MDTVEDQDIGGATPACGEAEARPMLAKVLRTVGSVLPVSDNRTGACNNCGACCNLPSRCVFLVTEDSGKSYCSVYRFRPPSCRKFPRTERQLLPVREVCGFSFTDG